MNLLNQNLLKWLTIFLLGIIGVGLMPFSVAAAKKETPLSKPLFVKGEMQIESEGAWKPSVEKTFLPADKVLSGKELGLEEILKNPEILKASQAVLAFAPGETVTLAQGGWAQRIESKKGVEYKSGGILHLFISSEKKAKTFLFQGLFIGTQKAHFYINHLDKNTTITLVEGSAKVVLDPKKPKQQTDLNPLDRLVLKKDQVSIESLKKIEDPFYALSLVPGFEKPGHYLVAGQVVSDVLPLQIERYGQKSQIQATPAALMEKDVILTSPGQKARLELTSNDVILLKENSSFTIETFKPTAKEPTLVFKTLGTLRAKIAKRKKLGRVRFRMPTAVVGVKGTEFESTASETEAEVLTLEGTVGVADADGKNEVLVEEGMQTKVLKGQKPEKAQPIPPERLDKLQKEKTEVTPAATGGGPSPLLEDEKKQLEIKEGTGLSLKWDQALASAKVMIGQKEIKATLSEDKTLLSIPAEDAFKMADGAKEIVLKIVAESASGTRDLELKALLVQKPEAPPQIDIGEDDKTIKTNGTNQIEIRTNRVIAGWEIELDGSKLDAAKVQKAEDVSGDATLKSRYFLSAETMGLKKEGQHSLKLVATDEFGLQSSKELTLILDQSPPLLVLFSTQAKQPATKDGTAAPKSEETAQATQPAKDAAVDDLKIKEGEGVVISWSKPIKSASIQRGETILSLKLSDDPAIMTASAEEAAAFFEKDQKTDYQIKAVDLFGNEKTLEAKILFRPIPKTAPALSLQKGVGKIEVGKSFSVEITSDRPVAQWTASLDGRDIMPPQPNPTGPLPKELRLDEKMFSDITDGEHNLSVGIVDEFGLRSEASLKILVDKTPPKVVSMSEPLKLDKIKLGKNAEVEVVFNEPIAKMEFLVDGKKSKLKLGKDKTGIWFQGNPSLLSLKPKPYELVLSDRFENQKKIQGFISLKTPRDLALRQNFSKSVLARTGEVSDRIFFESRPGFRLNSTEAPEGLESYEANQKKSTKRRSSNSVLNNAPGSFLFQLQNP